MALKKLTNYIAFNAIIGIILFLSSQIVLIILNGTVVGNIGLEIDYGFPYTFPDAIPTSHASLPNYPLYVLIFVLAANIILIRQLRKENNFDIPLTRKIKMSSIRFTTYIILFNLIMDFLLFISNQLIIIVLNGKVVIGSNFYIYSEYTQAYFSGPTHIPTAISLPIPNYPLILFIILLSVNIFFCYKLRKTNAPHQN